MTCRSHTLYRTSRTRRIVDLALVAAITLSAAVTLAISVTSTFAV